MLSLPLFESLFNVENETQINRELFQPSQGCNIEEIERVAATEVVKWSHRSGLKRSRETRVTNARRVVDSESELSFLIF